MTQLISVAKVAGVAFLACASNSYFVSSWKAPDAEPLGFRGSKVAAAVMMDNPSSRRAAEDKLASEITQRGAQGVALYTLIDDANVGDDAKLRSAFEEAQIKGVVVMRPMGSDKEVVSAPSYSGPMYGGYYGGYNSYGWGSAYGGQVYTNTIVSVETLVFSLDQNKLVWGGQSKTTNPDDVDDLVHDLTEAVTEELAAEGLISK